MNILQIEDARQSFRTGFWMKQVEVLHGVSLEVPEKSIFGFLGANGAGKTTLIQLIVGLRGPTSGKVRIRGDDATAAAARSRVGYLPERPYFYEHLTGAELLQYFGTLSGMSRSRILDRTPVVLKAVGMSHARDLELKKYSKGMLQRIGIAQAILHDPEFLVLDEPMSGLDPLGRKEMRELIVMLASEGRTVFFSSHVIPDVEAICDQVALIQEGKMVGCGPIGRFLEQGESQTEIGFTGLSVEKVRTISGMPHMKDVREIAGGIRATVSGQASVDLAIQQLVAARAQVLWVQPIRPSLESFFQKDSKGGYHD